MIGKLYLNKAGDCTLPQSEGTASTYLACIVDLPMILPGAQKSQWALSTPSPSGSL